MKIVLAIACVITLLSTSGCIIVHRHPKEVIETPAPSTTVVVPDHDHDHIHVHDHD